MLQWLHRGCEACQLQSSCPEVWLAPDWARHVKQPCMMHGLPAMLGCFAAAEAHIWSQSLCKSAGPPP